MLPQGSESGLPRVEVRWSVERHGVLRTTEAQYAPLYDGAYQLVSGSRELLQLRDAYLLGLSWRDRAGELKRKHFIVNGDGKRYKIDQAEHNGRLFHFSAR